MRKTIDSINLVEADLPGMEDEICAFLAGFLQFSSHGIYFPKEGENRDLTFLPQEKRLLIPLVWKEKFLGMLMLAGLRVSRVKRLLPWIQELARLVIERVAVSRAMNQDLQTGLATEECFFDQMEEAATNVRSYISDPVQTGQNAPLYKMCMGMVVICWYDGLRVSREFDYEFSQYIHDAMARIIKRNLPGHAVAASLGRHEGRHDFGIIFNAPGRSACQKLSENLLLKLEEQIFTDGPSGRGYKPVLYAGHAIYPQDMRGDELWLPMFEQAMRLRDRARLAARAACANGNNKKNIMSFAGILHNGGRLLEDAENGRARINLGLAVNAKEGMRFHVYGADGQGGEILKGQIVLLEADIMDSSAEIFYLRDAAIPLLRGDRLRPVSADDSSIDLACGNSSDDANLLSGDSIKSHGAFLSCFPGLAARCDKYVLALVRIGINDDAGKVDDFFRFAEKSSETESGITASYGSNGLIFFLPGKNAAEAKKYFLKYWECAKSLGLEFACGLFEWPIPNFGKMESEQCVLKAMEYAALLPEPHIGEFNSMALTISADKKFSLGDKFGSIQEYKLALLADPENALARNSLAVCLGALGKLNEAKKLLGEAMEHTRDAGLRAKICYNLGTIFQKDGDVDGAWSWYRKCLKHDRKHVFAWLRIGQLSEHKGRKTNARRYYLQAASLAGNDSDVLNIAQRNLARLESGGKENDRAMSILHDSLLRKPSDAASLAMLAQMYLGKNGDAAVAEMLASKSVKISNDSQAWEILARALEAQGKTAEAEKARLRAKK